MTTITALSWPASRAADALWQGARLARLTSDDKAAPRSLRALPSEQAIAAAATAAGLEAELLAARYDELGRLLESVPAALLQLPAGSLLVALGGRRGHLRLVGPAGEQQRLPTRAVVAALTSDLDSAASSSLASLLSHAGLDPYRADGASRVLLGQQLQDQAISRVWALRPAYDEPLWPRLRRAGVPHLAALFLTAHVLRAGLMIASWWVLGAAALAGRAGTEWLQLWGLLLLSQVPLGTLESWAQGKVAIRSGEQLKAYLLVAALALDPDRIRHRGAGSLLGRVLEAQALEGLVLGTAFSWVLALVDLLIAGVVLVMGAGGGLRLLVLLAWLLGAGYFAWRYFGRRRQWTEARIALTNDFVERMVGHRTRLAQQPPHARHEGEDELLASYVEQSRQLDTTLVRFGAFAYRGWLLVGTLTLLPLALAAEAPLAAFGIALGGILLAGRALARGANALAGLAAALVAWRQVQPLVAGLEQHPALPHAAGQGAPDAPMLEAQGLSYRYPGAATEALQPATLTLQQGDRVLLQGPSGGGKSTLAALLMGLRSADSGVLRLAGIKQQLVGLPRWRKAVSGAPQFHENHLFSGTLAFNLLMGRGWPASSQDMALAREICEELGLGPLLQRMPAGLNQQVGDGGWRLSHGERSRIFLARALLAQPKLTVVDESFGALDPESLLQAMKATLRHSETLLVIDHSSH